MRSKLPVAAFVVAVCGLGATGAARAQDLVVDGTTMTLGGVHRFDSVRVINGGRIVVPPFDGTDRVNTGNLVLVAPSILVDETSVITARGSGYQTARCGDGGGPTAGSGGRGGCAVRDSGGGGAHFGQGGRGTKDCFVFGDRRSCQLPEEFEEDCGNSLDAAGTRCTDRTNCWDFDALPTVAGAPYWHSIWEIEFGAAGGDKGCRDGDGFGGQPNVAGAGGGRIVLAALSSGFDGTVTIDGTVTADGKRGCGTGNDSAGGGAGGSVLIVADRVVVGDTARVSAAGGLGGDTFAAAPGSPDSADCPPGAQAGGTCDDCGGGGGGGIVSIVSRTATLSPAADFDVSGGLGGVCPICRGEAGGGAGELQLNIGFTGELCDGYDNDFDGLVDEDLGDVACGLGACETTLPACTMGEPTPCSPAAGPDPTCRAPAVCDRPRVAVILDTSASMLQDLAGFPTFGDGSAGHEGLDTDGDGVPNDSRLFLAKEALAQVISNYPEIDWSLARYHQDVGVDRSCQLATWIECAGIFATYDDPTDNVGPVSCTVSVGPSATVDVRRDSTGGEECINYAGSCGPPRRGADILAGFGMEARGVVRWLDHRETAFSTDTTPGDHCGHSRGGDCELRATGPTPLEGALEAVMDYVVPIRTTDPCTACRGYDVVLVTDGVESCGGDPAAAARELHDIHGIDVFVVAVSVLPGERAELDRIAAAGSGGARGATFVSRPEELVPALTAIVADSIRTEVCDGADNDCDGRIDEGFPGLGSACDDGGIGACRGTGTIQCTADGSGTECVITTPGAPPAPETCNELDDDCDGAVDEGLTCSGTCEPSGSEVCNGVDDDCNGLVDEADPSAGAPCGSGEGECTPGTLRCIRGELECVGGTGPRMEVCNGLDDDCDGVVDGDAPCPPRHACIEGTCRAECEETEFPCPVGLECVDRPDGGGRYCLPAPCAACTASERCVDDRCVDPCEGVECPAGERCERGTCRDCHSLGCPADEVCYSGECVPDPCRDVDCPDGEGCFAGSCAAVCDDRRCPEGERCTASGRCAPDACAAVSCGPSEVCVEGSCREDPCRGTICPAGDVCVASLGCIDDPCPLVRCPPGWVCRVLSGGEAQCAVDGDLPPDASGEKRVLATGGGGSLGCAAGGGAGGAAWALGLVLVVLARRRRGPSRHGTKEPAAEDPARRPRRR